MNPKKSIRFAGLTDIGRVREQNEDNWFADPEQGLFIISDGMGGHPAGELASRAVIKILPPLLNQRMEGIDDLTDPEAANRILEALSHFSDYLRNKSRRRVNLAGMGATVILALIRNAHALIAHMGDSRLYLLREEQFERLTRDHSMIQILIDTGEITPQEVDTHPFRGQITRYIGMDGNALPETRLIELLPGDRLLFCSDGLTGMLADVVITSLLLNSPTPEDACRALILAANVAGGYDNITVIVVDWGGNRC